MWGVGNIGFGYSIWYLFGRGRLLPRKYLLTNFVGVSEWLGINGREYCPDRNQNCTRLLGTASRVYRWFQNSASSTTDEFSSPLEVLLVFMAPNKSPLLQTLGFPKTAPNQNLKTTLWWGQSPEDNSFFKISKISKTSGYPTCSGTP